MKGRSSEAKLLAIIIAVAGLILIAYSLLVTHNSASSYGYMMGMGSSASSSYYGLTNMVLAILGTFMLASGALYTILRVDYEPVSYPVIPNPVAQPTTSHETATTASASSTQGNVTQDGPVTMEKDTPVAETQASMPSAFNEQNYLILRLLTGDERTIFRAVMDSGGEALQKDLIVTTKMSEAKVSRVIDRLVEKAIVSKERDGMGNRIRIQIDK